MYAKLLQHAKLTHRMARKVGYDIEAAVESGQLHPNQLQGMIQRCTKCAHPEQCAATPAEGTQVPSYCENRWMFSRQD